jgi:hypothetical protein
MRRFLISLLSLAALVIPTKSWEASTSSNLAINVMAGQAIAAVSLSNSSFTGGAASGTVVGAISVTMSPASPAFSGSLSLSGTNASSFQIVGSNLETNGALAAGAYNVNIVATEAGTSGSPFTQAETITGTTAATSTVESPGPSYTLWSNPYYSCVRNFYVNVSAASGGNGSSSSPWNTIAAADTPARTGGDCINVAPGTYSSGFNGNITYGGTTASSTGYVVYRCTAPGADHNTPGNGGGFSGTGCQITDGGKSVCTGSGAGCGTAYPSYLVFDGFSFVNTAENQFATAFTCTNGDVGPSSPGCHHWIIVNNVIAGYGQSGIQMNDTEYAFSLHNLVYNNSSNSGCDAGAQGSGISYAASLPVAGYTQTADDIGPTPELGIYSGASPNPFHQYIEWNVVYNNHMAGCGTGNSTDGNGIILDSNDQLCNGSTGVNYPDRFLVAFNVVYNNGGGGLHAPCSSLYTWANNTVFNNYLDPQDNGTARGSIDMAGVGQNPGNAVMVNNIAYAIIGASGECSNSNPLACNTPVLIGGANNDGYYNGGTSCGFTIDGVTDCGGNNITYLNGFTGAPPENPIYNANPAWSCTGNKCMTNPLWVNAGSTSAGTMSTPPTGANFALQSGSPAIGYGQTRPYLPAQSADAGACYHTLTSCP